MGARAGISEEEYLHTCFEGLDQEYRDGELEERGLPDYPHGETQLALALFFGALKRPLRIFPCVETRVKLRPGRYVIPDVAVFWHEKPPRVPETPPLVAIEILSPDERLPKVKAELEEYKKFGVPHIWLIDPDARKFYVYEGDLLETQTLLIPELGVELTAADVFE
jgi:Uma2 family endonuclease